RRRWPPPAAVRSAGLRQDPARHPPARPAARGQRGRGAGNRRGGLGRRARAGSGLLARTPVPRSAPHRQRDRPGRRGQRPASGRDLARPQRRAVPGRAARMGPRGPGGAARTARIGCGHDLARRTPGRVPGAVPAGGGHEPVSLRLGRRPVRTLPLHRRPDRALPRADLRPAARPHRPARRGTAPAALGTAAGRAARRMQRVDPRPGRGGARNPAPARRPPQRATLAGRHRRGLSPASGRPGPARTRGRVAVPVGALRAPAPARGPHHRGPGRLRRHRHRAPHRGPGLPPALRPRPQGRLTPSPDPGPAGPCGRRAASAVCSVPRTCPEPSMHRLLLASAVALALAAAGGTATAAPASLDEVELIPRDALFGNPERANVQMSPDGRYLSWIAPLDGTLNVWVAPADDPSAARAVTRDTARGIRSYFWSYLPDTLLYLRDTGGDEDFHLYAVDLRSGAARDLTPYGKTTARVVGVSRRHPGTVLVGMNDRDPQ